MRPKPWPPKQRSGWLRWRNRPTTPVAVPRSMTFAAMLVVGVRLADRWPVPALMPIVLATLLLLLSGMMRRRGQTRMETAALLSAAGDDGMPAAWFESAAVRAASGWNEWQGATYLSQEAWDELVGALAERDDLLGLPNARDAAAELRRRAAVASYRLRVEAAPTGGVDASL